MLARILGGILLLAMSPASSRGQAAPLLSKVPTVTDTQISGTAQGVTPEYDAILLHVCTSATATPPLDCSTEDTTHGRKRALVNLAGAPFVVNSPDGKFTVTIASPLAPGTYIWIIQITRSHTDHSEIVKNSNPVRVPVPLLRRASMALSGYDSASRDVGAKVTLDFDHGLQNEGLGETRFVTSGTYDDKWKHTAFTSNVTQNYSGSLVQLRQFAASTAWGPYATAYHNNTQGIRVEQIYGAGITHVVPFAETYYLSLSIGMQAMFDNLYTPGKSTNLGGLHLSGELNHDFRNKTSVDLKLEATPVFTQDRAWTAAGDFNLNIPISRRWSINMDVLDNYYEIAPKTFNKNYLGPAIGISFK
jgi:uncharacterized protein DUF481